MQDDDDNDDPMILNIRAKNHTSERTIVPWTVIFKLTLLTHLSFASLLFSPSPQKVGSIIYFPASNSFESERRNVLACFHLLVEHGLLHHLFHKSLETESGNLDLWHCERGKLRNGLHPFKFLQHLHLQARAPRDKKLLDLSPWT